MTEGRQSSGSSPVAKRTESQIIPLSKAPFLLSCHMLLFQPQIIWLFKNHFLCLLSVWTSTARVIFKQQNPPVVYQTLRSEHNFSLTQTDIRYKVSSSKQSQSEDSRKLSIACLLYSCYYGDLKCLGFWGGLQINKNQASKIHAKIVYISIMNNSPMMFINSRINELWCIQTSRQYSSEHRQLHNTVDGPHNIEQKKPDTQEYIYLPKVPN